jgi:(R)-2-hydroxyacyl-CoA dehydratese activating ATPase
MSSELRGAGLDIGSRSIELVVVDVATGKVLISQERQTTPDLAATCRDMLDSVSYDRIVATGYGRALAEVSFGFPSVTEIKAYARGAQALFPGCRTVLDIGGQDTKAIALDGLGRVTNFEMNDRCAAGTGRFLEMVAAALGYMLPELGPGALSGKNGVQISSMCAVFAESEIIGLLTKGMRREDIALAVHRTIATRTSSMLARVGANAPVVFAGGGARNPCLVQMMGNVLKSELLIPPQPQMLGSLGAALIAMDNWRNGGPLPENQLV